MKSSGIALLLATAGSFVAASPPGHRHQHKHADKRSPTNVKIVSAPGPTVVAYELNGQLIQESAVCSGIRAGRLIWAGGAQVGNNVCSASSQASVSTAAPAPMVQSSSSVVSPIEAYQQPSSSSSPTATFAHVQPSSSSTVAPSSTSVSPPMAPSPSASSSSSSSSSYNTNPASGQGLDKLFPDHVVDCAEFPSEYGPIHLSWLGFGGWSGVQYPTISGNMVTDIVTAIAGGQNCTAGAMCSYACPAGYQKSQWPSTQGSTGQSVGGLKCSENNKLVKTNPELSEYLCIKGTGATQVRNTMSKNAAICRTDYPGEVKVDV